MDVAVFQQSFVHKSRQWASLDSQVSCVLPALGLECCFPLLTDVVLIYLGTSKQNTWTTPRMTGADLWRTLTIDGACMRSLFLGPAETYIQPSQSPLSRLTPLIQAHSLIWTVTMVS